MSRKKSNKSYHLSYLLINVRLSNVKNIGSLKMKQNEADYKFCMVLNNIIKK